MGSTPDTVSTTDYLELRKAIDTAIQTFSKALNRSNDEKYGDILTKLSGKIGEVRTEIDASLVVKGKEKSEVKKPESKLGSKEMNLDDVKKFIDSKSDAIFVVTGGSFNPPHNGHIGMFQKAYDALMKVDANKSKKVYGVMVPATEAWLDKKVSENKLDASQKIDITHRVNLCTLSCDSYAWPDSTNFNASNMIVVNDGNDDPATSILQTATGFRDNAYYLCGSDYYAAHGNDEYKFICVLRSGVRLTSDRSQKQIHFDKPPITGSNLTSFNVKATDIIIRDDSGDNDASSTMLRNILTEINSVVVSGDALGDTPKKDELLKLISIPVLRRLLNLRYILTNTENNKKVLRIMDIDLDPPDAKSSNDTDIILRGKDGVRTSGARSLCNIGSMCYMNAALQLFYSMPNFRTAIKDTSNPLLEYLNAMDKGVNCEQAGRLARALYDLAQGTRGNAFTRRGFNDQEDASELITTVLSANIFDTLKESMRFNNSSIALVYTGEKSIDSTCKNIDKAALEIVPEKDKQNIISLSPLTPVYILPLPVTDGVGTFTTFKKAFDTYLDAYTDREELINDSGDDEKNNTSGIIFNLPECMMETITKGSDGKITSKKLKPACKPLIEVENSSSKAKPFKLKYLKDKTYISPGPTQKYFIVILIRTIYNDKGDRTKLKHPVNLEDASINIGGRNFTIKGCVCHHGESPNSGHYTYVEFKDGKPTTVYDDHNIVDYDEYVKAVGGRTVNTEGYVLLFEQEVADVK